MSKHELMLKRCDGCGAEAKRAYKKVDHSGELLLCEHHAQTNNEALEAQGFTTLSADMVPA